MGVVYYGLGTCAGTTHIKANALTPSFLVLSGEFDSGLPVLPVLHMLCVLSVLSVPSISSMPFVMTFLTSIVNKATFKLPSIDKFEKQG